MPCIAAVLACGVLAGITLAACTGAAGAEPVAFAADPIAAVLPDFIPVDPNI